MTKCQFSVADPDLELRGGGGRGGGGVLILLPCWPFSLESFLLFLSKIRGGGGHPGPSPRSATDFELTGEYGELSFNDFVLRRTVVILCHYFTSCTS